MTETSVTLNWIASTDNKGVAGYYVYRDGQQVSQTATTNYIDKYLMAGSTYIYTVKAFDHSGNVSEHSQPLSVTTLDSTSSSKYEAWSATNVYKAGDKVCLIKGKTIKLNGGQAGKNQVLNNGDLGS